MVAKANKAVPAATNLFMAIRSLIFGNNQAPLYDVLILPGELLDCFCVTIAKQHHGTIVAEGSIRAPAVAKMRTWIGATERGPSRSQAHGPHFSLTAAGVGWFRPTPPPDRIAHE